MSEQPSPPELSPRRTRMLRLARREGFVSIDDLARTFDLTPQTIRRDVNALCDLGLLRRHHGGAGLPSSVENADYQERQIQQLEEKRRIACLAASQVPNRASLFINIGTTTEEVTRALVGHTGLRVITNNLNVAMIMCDSADAQVIIAGGVVRPRDRGIIGEATIDFVEQFRVDIAVIGISGIDDEGVLLDFDYREVRVAQAIIRNSRRVFLVTDHTKFGRNALVRMGTLDQVDDLFTDRSPSPALRRMLREAGVALHVAGK